MSGELIEKEQEIVQNANFRMLKPDYLEMKVMATRDGITIQSFINRAIIQYCSTRGVELSGKDPGKVSAKRQI